jgi:hypothetical protein
MAANETSARMSILWLLLGVAMLALPPMLIVNWVFLGHPLEFPLPPTITAVVVAVTFSVLGSLLFRFRVSSDRVTGYTFFLSQGSVQRNEIDGARIRRILGFRYLEIARSSGPPILIPSYLRNREGFFRALIRFDAGTGPLAMAARDLLNGSAA